MPRILVIEDERDILRLLVYNLEKEGYRVTAASDGTAGLAQALKVQPDLILLDVMLPGMDGIEVCRQLRRESRVPIIMLTAKKSEVDKVLGLEIGADDYVTKPFSVRELLARIKTVLRRGRSEATEAGAFKTGSIVVDFDRYTLSIKNKPIVLSTKEFEFLKALIQAQGKVLQRDQLLERVWGLDASMEIDTRTIDQHIARFRDKLGSEAKRIVTVKNVGYRFDAD